MRRAGIRLKTKAAASVFLLMALVPCCAQDQTQRIAKATPTRIPCALVQGHPRSQFVKAAANFQFHHFFYQELVELKGKPSKCRGGLGENTLDGQSWWIEFSWPDRSKFVTRSDLPETSVAEYTRAEGLAQAENLINRTRKYAEHIGLEIDWSAAEVKNEGGFKVIEYTDPASGVNGFVRFTYDEKQRLVGVWVSMAL